MLLHPSNKNLLFTTHSSSQSIPHTPTTINILVSFPSFLSIQALLSKLNFTLKPLTHSLKHIMRICVWKFLLKKKKRKAGDEWWKRIIANNSCHCYAFIEGVMEVWRHFMEDIEHYLLVKGFKAVFCGFFFWLIQGRILTSINSYLKLLLIFPF